MRSKRRHRPSPGHNGLLLGIGDLVGRDHSRLGDAIKHAVANVTAVVLELVNLILRLHSNAPIPRIGIILSILTVLILLYSGWKGGDLVFRHGIGVDDVHGV